MNKINQKPINAFLFLVTTIAIVTISNSVTSYSQINSTSSTQTGTSSNQTTTTNSSNNPVVKSIDASISSLKAEIIIMEENLYCKLNLL